MKGIGIEVKWAVVFTLMMMVWMFIERILGFHDDNIKMHPVFTNFVAIPSIIIYLLALKDKKQSLKDEPFTWKKGFISGMIITVIIAVLSPLSQYIIHNYISPNYFKNVIDYAVETNHMTLETAQKYFSVKNYMLQSSFGSLIMGAITSAIVAFFVKTKIK